MGAPWNVRRLRGGFTLIELLVVIAIIGLLATLAVFAVGNARQQARDAKRVADVKQVQNALELYASAEGGYPEVAAAGVSVELGAAGALALCGAAGFGDTCTGTEYMRIVPVNPAPGGQDYVYSESGTCTGGICTDYSITFTLEDSAGGFSGACTARSSGITCP